MDLYFGNRGELIIDNARIVFRNFKGEASKFNRPGDRNFALVIPDSEIADKLLGEGWNVKIKPPKEEGDTPFMYLPIKVKFNANGPSIHLKSGNKDTMLSEDIVGCLDDIDIASVDLDVRPYDWEMHGETGRTAYLKSMRVNQSINDRFAETPNEGDYL